MAHDTEEMMEMAEIRFRDGNSASSSSSSSCYDAAVVQGEQEEMAVAVAAAAAAAASEGQAGPVASAWRRFLVEVLPAIMRRLYLLSQCQQYVVATCALEARSSSSSSGCGSSSSSRKDDDAYHESEILRIEFQTASMMRTSSFQRDEKLAQFMDDGSLIQLAVDMLLRGQRLAPFPACSVDADYREQWQEHAASKRGRQDHEAGVREQPSLPKDPDVLFTAIWLVLMLALVRVRYKMY
ncbi:unnamed protein product [Sphagnum jensenii]|uniref:Uncharacterized protein n=1 Tax=Sphagnum jensenii TaxID=128206 RepID=A0ABP0VYA9_9BRYO